MLCKFSETCRNLGKNEKNFRIFYSNTSIMITYSLWIQFFGGCRVPILWSQSPDNAASTLASKTLRMSVWRVQWLIWTVCSLITVRTPASWRVVNKVEICQLFSEFAIRLWVTSKYRWVSANRSENVINLSSFCQLYSFCFLTFSGD